MPSTIRRPSDAALQRLLARVAAEQPTYQELGATRDAVLPGDYRQGRHSVPLGHGPETFRRGIDALRQWQVHRNAGVFMTPTEPELVEGADVVATLRIGFIHVIAPCRIIYVTDSAGSFGFGYGTLPGHLESGEESFHVHMDTGGQVTFEVIFFARIVDLLARVGTPVSWVVQRHVTRQYLNGVRKFVDGT